MAPCRQRCTAPASSAAVNHVHSARLPYAAGRLPSVSCLGSLSALAIRRELSRAPYAPPRLYEPGRRGARTPRASCSDWSWPSTDATVTAERPAAIRREARGVPQVVERQMLRQSGFVARRLEPTPHDSAVKEGRSRGRGEEQILVPRGRRAEAMCDQLIAQVVRQRDPPYRRRCRWRAVLPRVEPLPMNVEHGLLLVEVLPPQAEHLPRRSPSVGTEAGEMSPPTSVGS